MSFLSATLSEEVKYRRTFARRLVVTGPALMGALYALLVAALGNREPDWSLFLATIFVWWVTVWVPVGAALAAGLADRIERRSGAWRALRARPLSPATLYVAKLSVLALQMLAGALVMAAVTGVVGAILAGWPVPLGRLGMVVFLSWLASLPLLSIGLWVSNAAGLWASVALGLVGMVAGAVAAETPEWLYVPWAWPARAAIPAAGVHANGLPLETGSELASLGVIPPVIGVSLAASAALALLGALWFSRREVR